MVPELSQELHVWLSRNTLYAQLQHLDTALSGIYRDMDSSSHLNPDISEIQEAIRVTTTTATATATATTTTTTTVTTTTTLLLVAGSIPGHDTAQLFLR